MDRKPEPPGSAEEWDVWVDACIQTNSRHYLPTDIGFKWPEGEPWPSNRGVSWIPLAEDHPFKGCSFCWRCIAEAEGWPLPDVIPHDREIGTVCWEPSPLDRVEQELSGRDEAAEDAESDGTEGRPIAAVDPARTQAVDTGTFFYVPKDTTVGLAAEVTPGQIAAVSGQYPGRVWLVDEASAILRGVSIDKPQPIPPERWESFALGICPGSLWESPPFRANWQFEAAAEFETLGEILRRALRAEVEWAGQPAVPDEPKRPAPASPAPVPQDAPDDEDRQPETDDRP